jgi:hypothetical protein
MVHGVVRATSCVTLHRRGKASKTGIIKETVELAIDVLVAPQGFI